MHIFFMCDFSSTQKYVFHREKVKPLVEFVSGAQYQSFTTRTEAVSAYQSSKARGLVRIVRDPGDDDIYGPMFYAAQ